MNLPAHQLKLSEIIALYDQKFEGALETAKAYAEAGSLVASNATVFGVYGDKLSIGNVCEREIRRSLLISAWRHVYKGLNIEKISSAADRNRFEKDLQNPPPFNMENIRATFGDFIVNPWQNVLRGLAEVFCSLDPYYKSHDKMKIGVKGLPKRVILTNVGDYGWGRQRVADVINALATLEQKPLVSYGEVSELLENGDCMVEKRGVRLKRFSNGNGHLSFEPEQLLAINRGLAEYYGEVLADCPDERPDKKQTSTAVSKDLQYYPTPFKVVESVLRDVYIGKNDKVLEPSCGCGRFLDALKKTGAEVFGYEYDAGRVAIARSKGHNVAQGNFLEAHPVADFDFVIMNPPFYGKHYVKHVEHAMKFLKPGGILKAILPATARYDHGLLEGLGEWWDLPVGSFSESGTNINTTILTIRRK
jgi:hypothetical protein